MKYEHQTVEKTSRGHTARIAARRLLGVLTRKTDSSAVVAEPAQTVLPINTPPEQRSGPLAKDFRDDSELSAAELKAWADAEEEFDKEEEQIHQAIAEARRPLPGEFVTTGAPPVNPNNYTRNIFDRLPPDHLVFSDGELHPKGGAPDVEIAKMMARAAASAYAQMGDIEQEFYRLTPPH